MTPKERAERVWEDACRVTFHDEFANEEASDVIERAITEAYQRGVKDERELCYTAVAEAVAEERTKHLEDKDMTTSYMVGYEKGKSEERKRISARLEEIHTPNKRGGWGCKHCTGYADDDVVCYKCIAKAIESQEEGEK